MASRVIVQESIVDKFLEALKASFERVSESGVIGDPMSKNTQVGPLADQSQFDRVMGFFKTGPQDGELVTGGVQRGNKGFFVEPTVFKNPSDDARIVQEEVFGPVIIVQTFKSEDEGVRMANDTPFGLSGELHPPPPFWLRFRY